MLLLDIGNTRLKWALWEGNQCLNQGSEVYSLAEIHYLLKRIFISSQAQQKVFISCVAGVNVEQAVNRWFQENWQVNVIFAAPQNKQLGLINAYADASALGVDRWFAMLGAWMKYKTACCVIDCGTAVTLDVVDANGQHLGGLIMPGLSMMRMSLMQGADGIDDVVGEVRDLANNTADAVDSGCTQLLVLGIEGLLKKYRSLVKGDLLCVITGGDGVSIAQRFDSNYVLEPDLVLDGLKEAVTAGL